MNDDGNLQTRKSIAELHERLEAVAEARRVKCDLAINRMKNSGELQRMEAHRALIEQIQHGGEL